MAEITINISNELATRIQSFSRWLPTILELGLISFKTEAVIVATEIKEFLEKNPSPKKVLKFHVSDKTQERMKRLLALNQLGILSELENRELDELERIEHIMVMLKTQIAKELKQKK